MPSLNLNPQWQAKFQIREAICGTRVRTPVRIRVPPLFVTQTTESLQPAIRKSHFSFARSSCFDFAQSRSLRFLFPSHSACFSVTSHTHTALLPFSCFVFPLAKTGDRIAVAPQIRPPRSSPSLPSQQEEELSQGEERRGEGGRNKGFSARLHLPDRLSPFLPPWHFAVRHVQTNKSILHSLFHCIARPLCAICQLLTAAAAWMFVLEGAFKRTR